MKPKPVSPFRIFIKELRKKRWISDIVLKRIMAPILERDGGLEDLRKALAQGGFLSPPQMEALDLLVKHFFENSSAQVMTKTYHPQEILDSLTERLSGEIEVAKTKEWEKMQELQQKAKSARGKSPLKILVKEIRRQEWATDHQLKFVLGEILAKEGTPKDFLEALKKLNVLDNAQIGHLMQFTQEELTTVKEGEAPVVRDELADLEKSLGGEVPIEKRKGGPPKHITQLMPAIEPDKPKVRPKPHSKNIRILSDEEGGNMGFFPKDDDGEEDKTNFFF